MHEEKNTSAGNDPGSIYDGTDLSLIHIYAEGQTGCRSVFDIAPAYLSAKTGEELRATLL